jgi:hypothetical protein
MGYQRYNPLGNKQSHSNRIGDDAKYYTYIPRGDIGFWGAETYDVKFPLLFLTEGIFNAVKIHNAGLPCLAVLSSCPSKQTVGLLNMLPQRLICIKDNDGGAAKSFTGIKGEKLYPPNQYGDIGDMPQDEVDVFITQITAKYVE